MAHDEEIRGSIHCDLTPCDDGRTKCELRIQGSGNALLNAYEQITRELLKSIIHEEGKEVAMSLYAAVQMNALKAAGINPEEEVEEKLGILKERLEKEAKKRAVLDGLKDILSKTFTMPEKKEGEAE